MAEKDHSILADNCTSILPFFHSSKLTDCILQFNARDRSVHAHIYTLQLPIRSYQWRPEPFLSPAHNLRCAKAKAKSPSRPPYFHPSLSPSACLSVSYTCYLSCVASRHMVEVRRMMASGERSKNSIIGDFKIGSVHGYGAKIDDDE